MSKGLKSSMALALFSIVFAVVAAAQGGDSGQYTILQARYGTERKNVDVTTRLKELARADRTFRMGNSTFGVDPDPGRVKTLRIFTRGPNGQNRMFEYREGSVVDGSQFRGWNGGNWGGGGWEGGWGGGGGGGGNGDSGQYTILQARYGTERNNVDVTNRLKELARADRRFRMGNSTFGVDPDPGRVKTLRIFARGPAGRNRTFEYREGSTVDGSQFRGWSGGNWGGGWEGGWGGGGGGGGGHHGRLTIVNAHYGAGHGRGRNVGSILQSQIQNGRLNLEVNNSTMGGDPAPGQSKRLTVTYSVNGQRRSANMAEGQQLNIP